MKGLQVERSLKPEFLLGYVDDESMDRLTPEQRSKNMAAIRSKNTKPELYVRRVLHAHGFRFRIHRKDLPGKPDIVFPSRKCAIFVNGCFWHGHECQRAALPATRREYWKPKIERTKARDAQNCRELRAAGWNVKTVWECDLRRPITLERIIAWLQESRSSVRIAK